MRSRQPRLYPLAPEFNRELQAYADALAKSRSGLRKAKDLLREVLGEYDATTTRIGEDPDCIARARKLVEPYKSAKTPPGGRAKVIYPPEKKKKR